MSQEKSPDQTNGDEPIYTGRVLPGSRWRQRAFGGHTEQTVTVLRVGARSVMLVIEGGKLSGHDRQKVGQRFNVVLETFLKTHTLIEQPKGYRPGDEVVSAPKKDTVETYFRRRRYAQEWIDNMEGDNIRAATLDPRLPVVPDPVYEGDAFLAHPVVAAEVDRRVEEALAAEPTETAEPTPPPQEEPVSNEPTVITATDEEVFATLHQIEAEDLPTEPIVEEADPLEAFLGSGRAIVEKLTRQLDNLAHDRDDHLALAERLDARYQAIKAQRDRIESAVLAAMGSAEEPAPEPAEPVVWDAPVVVTPIPRVPHVQRHGPLPATEGTQRSWVLDRLAQAGRIHVGSVADEFAAAWGLSRESAIKNMASILGDQVNRPNPQWPTAQRVGKGDYRAILNG